MVAIGMYPGGLGKDIFTYTGTSTGAGTFAQTRAGAPDVDNWVYQADFNVDKLDGTGPSGFKINQQKGNVYQIAYQWLGYGRITYSVENSDTGRFIPFHVINYANKNVTPSLLDSSMQLEVVAASLGGTTNVTTSCASMGAYIQGRDVDTGPLYSVSSSKTVSTTETALFSIKPKDVFFGKINFSEVHPRFLSFSSASSGNKPGIIRVYKNTTLGGTPNFQDVDTDSSVRYDTAGTTITGGKRIATFTLTSTGSQTVELDPLHLIVDKLVQITVTAQAVSGSIDFASSITWEEDT